MLKITVPAAEFWDEIHEEFVYKKEQTLLLRKQRGEDGRTLGSPGKRKQLNIRGIHCAQRVCRR